MRLLIAFLVNGGPVPDVTHSWFDRVPRVIDECRVRKILGIEIFVRLLRFGATQKRNNHQSRKCRKNRTKVHCTDHRTTISCQRIDGWQFKAKLAKSTGESANSTPAVAPF